MIATQKSLARATWLFLFASFAAIYLNHATPQDKPGNPAPQPPKVRVIGLEIHRPLPEVEQELKTSESAGVVVHLLIHCKGRTIIDVGDESSQLSSFVDDKGTNFLKDEKGKTITPVRWIRRGAGFLKFSRDGYCALRIESPVMPAAAAQKLLLKGRIGCEVGTETRIFEWASPSKANKFEKKLDSLAVLHGEKQVALTLDKPNRLKDVYFIDSDDAKTKASPSSTGWSGGWQDLGESWARSQHFYSYYDIKAKYPKVSVEFYEKHETVEAPFEVEINLGLR